MEISCARKFFLPVIGNQATGFYGGIVGHDNATFAAYDADPGNHAHRPDSRRVPHTFHNRQSCRIHKIPYRDRPRPPRVRGLSSFLVRVVFRCAIFYRPTQFLLSVAALPKRPSASYHALPTRPKRSVLVLFVAAAYQGFTRLHVHHFAHPTFAPGRIARRTSTMTAALRGRTKDLTLIGYGKSSLDAIAKGVLARRGRTLVPDRCSRIAAISTARTSSTSRRSACRRLYFNKGTDFDRQAPRAEKGERSGRVGSTHYHQPSDQSPRAGVFDDFA